ncbi:Bug family tripartite tricarboxylate transporter substrate binding protein [Bordetella petrii]|uniref:Bug family tripartite tricarboxylate transporter substrate binding protein n=1 Tax=Bordetella petrii TaxID=94624 RepID=UPI001E5310A3|nr:tripartite tricarboxylate transporter substrate binding protein [Bordetella petrii]MCD0505174.1 tripartite tricarboxylate transporter substrate binding protein [Bordetella petrii]
MSTALKWLACTALAAAFAGPAIGQDWTPTRPIEILVGFAPGGSADQIARQLSEAVKDTVPVPVVVINKPGVAGVLAAQEVAGAEPDGYKLFVGGGSETTSVGNHKKISYDPRQDFTPVLKVARLPSVLAVNVKSPYPDMKALIEAARGKPEALSYGSTGDGSLFHSTMLAFEANSGLRFLHVPYKGAAASLTALAAGEVDMAFGAPEEVRGLIDAGRIRPIAVFSKTRVESMPDIPTMSELGYPVALDNMKGLLAPAGLPQPAYQYLNRVFHQALDSPSWKTYTQRSGLSTDYADGPAFQQEIDESYTLIGNSLAEIRKAAK